MCWFTIGDTPEITTPGKTLITRRMRKRISIHNSISCGPCSAQGRSCGIGRTRWPEAVYRGKKWLRAGKAFEVLGQSAISLAGLALEQKTLLEILTVLAEALYCRHPLALWRADTRNRKATDPEPQNQDIYSSAEAGFLKRLIILETQPVFAFPLSAFMSAYCSRYSLSGKLCSSTLRASSERSFMPIFR